MTFKSNCELIIFTLEVQNLLLRFFTTIVFLKSNHLSIFDLSIEARMVMASPVLLGKVSIPVCNVCV